MHGLKVLLSKNFIDNLREETQKGRLKKVQEGYFISYVPYGYKKINKKDTVIHPQTSKFVKRNLFIVAIATYNPSIISDIFILKGISDKFKCFDFL